MVEEENQAVEKSNEGDNGQRKLADELTWNRFYARVREIDHAARLESTVLLGVTILLLFALYSASSDNLPLISVALPWLGVVASLTCYWRGYLGEQNRRALAARWQESYPDEPITPFGREEEAPGPATLSSYGLVALAIAVFWLMPAVLTLLTFSGEVARQLQFLTALGAAGLPIISVLALFLVMAAFQSNRRLR